MISSTISKNECFIQREDACPFEKVGLSSHSSFFCSVGLWYLCPCVGTQKVCPCRCSGRNAKTEDEPKYHWRGSSGLYKTPMWDHHRGLFFQISSFSWHLWDQFFFFFVNFIIHLHFLPRVLKTNIVRADAYIAISWYLFTTCYVLHTVETNMSQA